MHVIFNNNEHALVIIYALLYFNYNLINNNDDLLFDSLYFILKHIEIKLNTQIEITKVLNKV